MAGSIVDPDLAGIADCRRAQESDDEMRIGIDADSMIRRIHSDPAGLRQPWPGRQNRK
jgi:hypothetical protein